MGQTLEHKPETIKLLEESIGGKLLDVGLGDDSFFETDTKSNKSKNKQVGLHQTKNSEWWRKLTTK